MGGYTLVLVGLKLALDRYDTGRRSENSRLFDATQYKPEGQWLFRLYRRAVLGIIAFPLILAVGATLWCD